MSEGPVDLHTKLQATQQRMLAALSDIGDRSGMTNRVISGLRSQLLNYLHCLFHCLDAAANVRSSSEQRRLITAARLGARRLEDNIDKIVTVAAATSGNLQPEPAIRSLRSLTHESIIYVQSLYPDAASIGPLPLPADTDFAVVADARYLGGLLSCCVSSLARRPRVAEVSISIDVVRTADQLSVTWRLCGQPVYPGEQSRFENQQPALARLDDYYLEIVSQLHSSSVSIADGAYLEIASDLSVVREIDLCPLTLSSGGWTDRELLIIDAAPARFTDIPRPLVQISELSDLQSRFKSANSGLLILHHDRTPEPEIARNLEACRLSNMPVLLRACELDYEVLKRFRGQVDSIVIEPSSPAVLSRQIRGLPGTIDRRSTVRPVELV